MINLIHLSHAMHLVAQSHIGHLVTHRNTRKRCEIKKLIWCIIVNFKQISHFVLFVSLNKWIPTGGSCYGDIMFHCLFREFVLFYLKFYRTCYLDIILEVLFCSEILQLINCFVKIRVKFVSKNTALKSLITLIENYWTLNHFKFLFCDHWCHVGLKLVSNEFLFSWDSVDFTFFLLFELTYSSQFYLLHFLFVFFSYLLFYLSTITQRK